MSHTVSMKTQLKDEEVVKATAAALGLICSDGPVATRMYGGQTYSGLAVNLPGWSYPIVIEHDGTVRYDNYNGAWGKEAELDTFIKRYGVEVVKKQMRAARRPLLSETVLPSGDVKLVYAG